MSDLFLRPLFTWRSAVASPFGPKNPTTRHVLLTLALHMNEKGESCFPSIELLVDESGLSRRSVIEHLKMAAEAGWIGKRDRRERNGQGWRRVEYIPLIPEGVDKAVKDWDEERRARRAPRSDAFHGKQGGASPAPRKASAPDAPRKGGAQEEKRGAPGAPDAVHDVHPSTSVSTSIAPQGGRAARDAPRPGENYIPPQSVIEWVERNGYTPFLQLHIDQFRDTCTTQTRKPYVERGLDAAFRKCVREDWGGVRKQVQMNARHGGPRIGGVQQIAQWWETRPGLEAKAKELGIKHVDRVDVTPGENVMWLRARVYAALGDGPWLSHDKSGAFADYLKRARELYEAAHA